MSKIKRIFETTQEILFISPQKEFSLYWKSFLLSELGKVYQSIPWTELVKSLNIKNKRKGRTAIFTPQGKVALMFLKSYTGSSDRKLLEDINGNIHHQMFCGIFLGPDRLDDFKIVSRIRTELSGKLDIKAIQQVLTRAWKPYIKIPNVILEDATCYETSMRHPTNVKLLWECIDWLHGQMKLTCKYLKIRTPRTKYLKQKDRYLSYSRKRHKRVQERIVLNRSLLHLLNKIVNLQGEIEKQYNDRLSFPIRYYKRFGVIKKILSQQKEMFETGTTRVPDKILSIDKNYIRPIIRGKETKKVEFGAKINMIQADGINFIEHLSFDAFNEGVRLINSIWYSRTLFGKITHVAADAIYATNKNRKYCTSAGITTDFKRKGKAGKHEEHRLKIAKELRKERATRMEGSFGTEKQHYGLNKIRARTKLNEMLWIFFGVHTANAVRIAKRLAVEGENSQTA